MKDSPIQYDYFVFVGEQPKGPYQLPQMQAMWRSGMINGKTQYWREGLAQWAPCSSIAPLLGPSQKAVSKTEIATNASSPPTFSVFTKVFVFVCGGIILLIILVAALHNLKDHGSPLAFATTSSVPSSKNSAFILDPVSKEGIADTMKGYGARDIAILAVGNEVRLVYVVPFGTPKSRAKELGDNFVRLVKSLSNDDGPDKEIGRGKFTYDVAAITPDEKFLVRGTKLNTGTSIWW